MEKESLIEFQKLFQLSDLELESLLTSYLDEQKRKLFNDLSELTEAEIKNFKFIMKEEIVIVQSKIVSQIDDIHLKMQVLRELANLYIELVIFDSNISSLYHDVVESYLTLLSEIVSFFNFYKQFKFQKMKPDSTINTLNKYLFIVLAKQINIEVRGNTFNSVILTSKYTLLEIVITTITDIEFLIDNSELSRVLSIELKNRIERLAKQQARIVYSKYFTVKGIEGKDAFNKLLFTSSEIFDIQINDVRSIDMDDLIILMRYTIIPDINHIVISEIDNSTKLAKLMEERLFEKEMDKVIEKLDRNTIFDLLQTINDSRIIEYLNDKEFLISLFHKLNDDVIRIQIAMKLRNNDIAFELIEEMIAEEMPYYIMEYMKELILLLTRKQLLILRLTSHTSYMNLIQEAINKKEKRDAANNEFFA